MEPLRVFTRRAAREALGAPAGPVLSRINSRSVVSRTPARAIRREQPALLPTTAEVSLADVEAACREVLESPAASS